VASFVQTTITVVIVGLFWATGQDPYLDLYVLMAILGTFAILVVQTLCSFAVIGHFARNHPDARHWFRTFLAPLIGGISMAAVVVLLILNLGTAAGDAAETLVFKLIPWIVVGVFLGGITLYLRARCPDQ
jgi:NADH:ubiquinone oxidoreductase subunit 5 (subunit L)/multisubunit Na+/H+ antiporter MnhA subunit